jgi:hypothetical protein
MVNLFLSLENIINEDILGVPRRWLGQQLHRWLQPLIIGGLLLVSAVAAYKGSPRYLLLILVLPVGVGAVLAFMRWPALGLVAIIGTIIIPINGPSNANATMALVALLSGLWILDMMVRQRKIQLPSSLPIRPLLALVLVAVLSFGFGQLPWYTFAQAAPLGAQLGGLSMYVLSAAAFLLVACYARAIRWLEWMSWLFVGLGAIFIAGYFVPGLDALTERFYTPQTTGSLFWTWLVIITFSQAVFNKSLKLGWRIALGALALATIYVGVFELREWNSGWMPPLVAIAVILWMGAPRLGFLLTLAGIAGVMPKIQKLIDVIVVEDNAYSLMTRLEAWKIVLEIAKVNPLLGLGPANYNWYTPLFPILGYAVRFNSHNQYIDLIAQTGILGLVCFLWFFAAVGWLGWRIRQQVPEGFARAYVYGAIGGVAGTLAAAALGDWVIPFFYNITLGGFRASVLPWLFLGGLVALEQIINSGVNQTEQN